MLACHGLDFFGQVIRALGKHHRGRGLLRVVAQGHGDMGGVGHHHVGLGHVLHHALHDHFHHLAALLPLDDRVAFGLLALVLHFVLGHLHAFFVGKARLPDVKSRDGQDGQQGIVGQLEAHLEHVGGHAFGRGVVHGQEVLVFLINEIAGNQGKDDGKQQAFNGAQGGLGRKHHLFQTLDDVEALPLELENLGGPELAHLEALGRYTATFNHFSCYTANQINILLISTTSSHYDNAWPIFLGIAEYLFFRNTFTQNTSIFNIWKLAGSYLLFYFIR